MLARIYGPVFILGDTPWILNGPFNLKPQLSVLCYVRSEKIFRPCFLLQNIPPPLELALFIFSITKLTQPSRWEGKVANFQKMMICQKLLKMTNQGIQFVHKQQILVLKTFPPICFFCFRWKRRKGEDCQNWDQSNFMLSLVTEKIIQQRQRKWRRKSKAMFPPDNLVLSQHQLRNKYMKKRRLHISCNLSAWNKETRECLNQTGRHAKQSNPPTARCKLASSYSLAWHMASFYSAVG